jgi:hypothetical protein
VNLVRIDERQGHQPLLALVFLVRATVGFAEGAEAFKRRELNLLTLNMSWPYVSQDN